MAPVIYLTIFLPLICYANCINDGKKSQTIFNEPLEEEGRIMWAPLGAVIEFLPFFPITVNIPDIIYGFGDMMNSVYQYFTGSSESTSDESSTTSGSTPRLSVETVDIILEILGSI